MEVQSVDNPKAAPACEYVAIPEGSSSLAPVTKPGPIIFQYRWIFDVIDANHFNLYWTRYEILFPRLTRQNKHDQNQKIILQSDTIKNQLGFL